MNATDIAARRGASIAHVNGIDIAYTDVGDGPPLVLLHGAMASTGPAWEGSPVAHVDHFTTLGKHFRVIAPDTRGSGATVHQGGASTFDVLTDDVIGLIEALGLEKPFIAGFSEGGATATIVTLRRPDLVRALINHGGFDYLHSPEEVFQGIRMFFGGGPTSTSVNFAALEAALKSGPPPMAATFATSRSDYDDAQGEGHWQEYMSMFFERHVTPWNAKLADLPDITCPTLILSGDRDMFCSVEAAVECYRALPNGELAITSNTGHEITPAVIDAMTDFFQRHV